MADENTTPGMDVQQGKKITVKLKPLALKNTADGAEESASVAPEMKKATQVVRTTDPVAPEIPVAPEMKKATQVVKTTDPVSPEVPAAPEMKKATQVVKTTEPIAVEPAVIPLADSTQAVKKPTLSIPKPAAPAADATQAVKKPEIATPATPASADATQVLKKPTLSIPKPAAPPPTPNAAPADGAPKKPVLSIPKPPAPAAPAVPAQNETGSEDAAKTKIDLKKEEPAVQDELIQTAKPTLDIRPAEDDEEIILENASDEPGIALTIVVALACILILLGTYVLFANYSKLWMPELDAYADKIPQPPAGLLIK